jgi:hypothetical protein
MMWRFSRRKEEIRLETWYDKHTSEFIADIAHPGGERESKRFLNQGVFRTWLATWGRQLCAQGWTQSGPFLFEPDPHDGSAPHAPAGLVADTAVADRIVRTYVHGARTFEVLLSRINFGEVAMWTVERATETANANRRLSVPGLYAVASSSEAAAFDQACDCIQRWLKKLEADGSQP